MEKTGSKPIDELVRLARIGDGMAFTALWDTHIDALKAYLRKTMPSLDDFYLDDICSKSFEKAFRQISSYDPSKALFITWLRTIARNTAIDTIESEKKASRRTVSLDDSTGSVPDALDDTSSPLDTIIKDEATEQNETLIEGLPALYRDVARCRFIEDMQYKEISEELGMEINTVRTRIRRAKALMDKMKTVVIALLVILPLASCRMNGRGRKATESAKTQENLVSVTIPSFVQDKDAYYVLHYWEGVCADTLSRSFAQQFEQAFSNFAYLLDNLSLPREVALSAASNYYLCTKEYSQSLEIARKYLFDPNSPFRDEDLYAQVLRSSNPSHPLLECLDMNKVGTLATDFDWFDSNGVEHTLYDVSGADYIIVLFGNIGCHACKDVKETFDNDSLFGSLVSSGKVAFISIPVDDDLEYWDTLYYVRAIPSIYLLSGDKRVIYKDCPTDKLMNFLHNRYDK